MPEFYDKQQVAFNRTLRYEGVIDASLAGQRAVWAGDRADTRPGGASQAIRVTQTRAVRMSLDSNFSDAIVAVRYRTLESVATVRRDDGAELILATPQVVSPVISTALLGYVELVTLAGTSGPSDLVVFAWMSEDEQVDGTASDPFVPSVRTEITAEPAPQQQPILGRQLAQVNDMIAGVPRTALLTSVPTRVDGMMIANTTTSTVTVSMFWDAGGVATADDTTVIIKNTKILAGEMLTLSEPTIGPFVMSGDSTNELLLVECDVTAGVNVTTYGEVAV